MYTFNKTEDSGKLSESSKILNILEGFPSDYSEQCALIYGRLQALFGKPLYETMNVENQYSYIIEVTHQNGKVFYLNAYEGSSGPAIGGNISIEGIEEAAEALITYIQSAEPVDYDYLGYYPDTDSKISTGVKDGEPYYIEEILTDDEEIKKMVDSIY